MTHPLANFVLFQLGWIVTVLSAAAGYPWLGPLYALIWLGLHLRALAGDRGVELALITAAFALGALADSALVLLGLIDFPQQARLGFPTTLWMAGLWAMFAATLRHAMGWLTGRYLLAVLFGLAGGPLAYWAGERLGALLVHTPAAWPAIALEWGLAMPLLLWVAGRLRQQLAPAAEPRMPATKTHPRPPPSVRGDRFVN